MQFLFFTPLKTGILCFVLWPVLQVSAALICLFLPDKAFNNLSILSKTYNFEQGGKIYIKLFKVNKWKHLLPDGGAVFKKLGYSKKHITNFSVENLNKFLVESVRAEASHWLAILPFFVFGFFSPFYIIFIMLFYALSVNIPCIIAQRYNRPRILEIIQKLSK